MTGRSAGGGPSRGPARSGPARLIVFAGCIVATSVVGWLDYLTGAEIALTPGYLAVTIAGGWFLNRAAAAAVGVLAGAMLGVMSEVLRSEDLPAAAVAWNTASRVASYTLIAALVSWLRARTAELETSRAAVQREMAQRQAFTEIVAHELRNPLVGIRAAATTVARRLGDGELARRVDGIINEASAALSLLDDLRETSRVEAPDFKVSMVPTDLAALAREVAGVIEADGHPVEIRASEKPVWVLGDRTRLAQVIRNLLSNARKYSPAGAAIEVTVDRSDDGERTAFMMVRDHGVGVPEAERGKLFQKFQRLSSAGGTPGSGLGLYVSREIIHAHGGELVAHWPPGGGTAFVCRLPAHIEDAT